MNPAPTNYRRRRVKFALRKDAPRAGGVSEDGGDRSGAEPSADGAPGFVVVADDAESGGDRNGEEQAHATPDPTPEKQRDGDGDGVETNAAADERGGDEI